MHILILLKIENTSQIKAQKNKENIYYKNIFKQI